MEKSSVEPKSIFFNVRLAPSQHEALRRLAHENDRTVAAELRVAVRAHLLAANGNTKEAAA